MPPAVREPDFVTRFLPVRATRMDVSADERMLTGYAIVFNSLSLDLGGFKERILPEAVDRTLNSGANVDALADHRPETSTVLGSTDSGLLRLRKDRHGLAVEIRPPDTQASRDLITNVKAGLVRGMSFAFSVYPRPDNWLSISPGEDWNEEDGVLVRTISDMTFSEVSIVLNPAYPSTSISARSAELDGKALDAYRASKPAKRSREYYARQLRARGIV